MALGELYVIHKAIGDIYYSLSYSRWSFSVHFFFFHLPFIHNFCLHELPFSSLLAICFDTDVCHFFLTFLCNGLGGTVKFMISLPSSRHINLTCFVLLGQ